MIDNLKRHFNILNKIRLSVVFKVTIILILNFKSAYSIGCYKCSTTNNDTNCIDPFNPGNAPPGTILYEPDCKSGMHDRVGLFPARYCLKVSGYRAGTQQQIVIRTCTVSKLLESDSSHSSFTLKLENGSDIQVVSGLIASCKDDGCNSGFSLNRNKSFEYFSLVFISFIFTTLSKSLFKRLL